MFDWAPMAGDMDREPPPPPPPAEEGPEGEGAGRRGDRPGWGAGGVPGPPPLWPPGVLRPWQSSSPETGPEEPPPPPLEEPPPLSSFVRRRHEVVQSSSGTLRRAVSYMFSSSSARWRLVFTAVSFLGNVRPPFWEIRSLPPPLPPPCSLARQSSLLVRQRSLARSPPFSMCALAAPLCLPLCLALCRCRVRCLPACLSSRGTPAVRARRVLFFSFFPQHHRLRQAGPFVRT